MLIRFETIVDTFSWFYKENRDRLYAYLLRMTADAHVARDLVQESFVRYLEHYGSHKYNKSLLYTLARNAALDGLRKRKMAGLDVHNRAGPGDNPEQQMINREAFDATLAAIARLAPLDRELISLVATADLTYQEMGRILNISEANVKVRVHRARKKLREILASGGDSWIV